VYALRTESSLSTQTVTQSAYTFRLSQFLKNSDFKPQNRVAINSQHNFKRNHFHCDPNIPIALQIISLSLTKPSAWLRGKDLNLRPSGYEPDELPDCSTPRLIVLFTP
jgi:hypothetical protein